VTEIPDEAADHIPIRQCERLAPGRVVLGATAPSEKFGEETDQGGRRVNLERKSTRRRCDGRVRVQVAGEPEPFHKSPDRRVVPEHLRPSTTGWLDRPAQLAQERAEHSLYRPAADFVRHDQWLIDADDFKFDACPKILNGACGFLKRGRKWRNECQRRAIGADVGDRPAISAGPG
jgi:hypothetical protein